MEMIELINMIASRYGYKVVTSNEDIENLVIVCLTKGE